jgi:hypothetical protein
VSNRAAGQVDRRRINPIFGECHGRHLQCRRLKKVLPFLRTGQE